MNYTEIINGKYLEDILNQQKYKYYDYNYNGVVISSMVFNLIFILIIYLFNIRYYNIKLFKSNKYLYINLFPPLILYYILKYIIIKFITFIKNINCKCNNNRIQNLNEIQVNEIL